MAQGMIIGEAWGADEEIARMPFVGTSGWMLNSILEDAGLDRSEFYVTNVFNLRPMPRAGSPLRPNDIENLAGLKSESVLIGAPPIARGKYLLSEYQPELHRLREEIEDVKPNLIIAAGGTAAWALLQDARIKKLRGTVASAVAVSGSGFLSREYKVLPVYHPTYVLRSYSDRPVTVLDFLKARRELVYPEIRRPHREIWIEPSLPDLELFYDRYLKNAKHISLDIETAFGQITCIGFAPSIERCIVVPFVDNRKPSGSYWPTRVEERLAWRWVQKVCANASEKVLQNAPYDLHWLWRKYGITLNNFTHDTMLMHHALNIESPKGLEFLGSVYTNEQSWKLMRTKGLNSAKREG